MYKSSIYKYLIVFILLISSLLILFLLKNKEKPTFIIQQLSYNTTCAEEDNVILKINSANKDIKGVNILTKRPIFKKSKYDVLHYADYSGCNWASTNYQTLYYYPKCSIENNVAGYIDKNNVCRSEVREKIFDDGKWQIVGDRGIHWQPFMNLTNQDNQSMGEYKSLTIQRLEQPDLDHEPPVIAVIYSDGYMRPTYFTRANELGGWGGSFILGDSKFIKFITDRFYNNIKQIRIIGPTDGNLSLELFFINNPNYPAKLVIHYDYDKKGIDFFPPENNKNSLLTFVSMYKDKTSFDIELLRGKEKNKELVYNIMDPLLSKTFFTSRFLLEKDNPSVHSTLAPDFEITGIFEE